MPLEHAPSTETLFHSLQHDRDREARRRVQLRQARAAGRRAWAGRVARWLGAALRRSSPAARRANGTDHSHPATENGARDPRSHPELGTHRSTTQGAPCPSCA
jgi:hypothetical protein